MIANIVLSSDEQQLVFLVRGEVARIVDHVRHLDDPKLAEQFVSLAIDEFAEQFAEFSSQFALVTARHLSREVHRLRLH